MFKPNAALLLVIGCLFVPINPCIAQESEPITLRFLSFPRSITPKSIEFLVGQGETIEVATPSNALSQTYQVKRQSRWAVGSTEVDNEGQSTFVVYGHAQALASSKQLILLIRKGPEDADGMEVIPIDIDVKNFGGGKFLFINAAKVDIAGEVGGEKFAIQPGKRAMVEPELESDGRNFHVQFFFRKEDDARPFFSSRWPVSNESRGLIFFFNDPHTNQLRLHTIRDFF